jgi:hypothetical protein
MAEVLISPTEKKAIQGYVHIALAVPQGVTPSDGVAAVPENLARLINRHTNIQAEPDMPVKLADQRLFMYPFVIISADAPYGYSDTDIDSLGRFIHAGGFVVIENRAQIEGIDSVGDSVKELMRRIIDPRYLRIWPLDSRHALYHCFFDLNPGVMAEGGDIFHVEGIYFRRQLVAVYIPSGISRSWNGAMLSAAGRLGVNLVVFALSQGRWYDSDKRLAFQDPSTKTYYQWYESGRIKFIASEWLGVRKPEWTPSNKIMRRIVKNNYTKETLFVYDDYIITYVKNYNRFADITTSGPPMNLVRWGEYNLYEGWHENGAKMYRYDYRGRTYTEWDDLGMELERGESRSGKNQ